MTHGVRFGKPEDIGFIMNLERDSLAMPWSAGALSELLGHDPESNDNVSKFALVIDDIGYIGVSAVIDEAEIGNIVIAPDCRGQGYGCILLKALEKQLDARGVKKIFLEVERTNTGALALYHKCGFAEYGSRKEYYGAGRDAVLMSKEIVSG